MKRPRSMIFFTFLLGLTLAACAIVTPEPTITSTSAPVRPTATPLPTPTPTPTTVPEEPVQITGSVGVSNSLIVDIYFFEKFVMLEDLTGFVTRDYEYQQPLDAQILGPVTVDDSGNYTYTINLPAQPTDPLNDVDNNGTQDQGVEIWQLTMTANLIDDPFLGKDETAGWSSVYTSAHIDSENKNEINGGKILIWAPDDQQQFPTGFGDDGLLFTADDPVGPVPAGYSVIDLDATPFAIQRDTHPTIDLMEGDITVKDYSSMTWSDAFDTLVQRMSVEYPFTDLKHIDWQALHDEFAPRIADAQANNDQAAYERAIEEFTWQIPDGHVATSAFDVNAFQTDVGGSYGISLAQLDDGSVAVVILSDGGPAANAGMEWGATITEWNGQPIMDALSAVVPWSSPFSSDHSRLIQQLRYLVADPVGTESTVTFQNPGSAAPQTVSLTAVADTFGTFNNTSVRRGRIPNALPIEYKILDSGYGYIAVTSLSDDLNLTIRLWQHAIKVMSDNNVPGIIIDLRHNDGGSPIGTYFAGAFTDQHIDVSRSYYYSEETGQFETYGPPDYVEPDTDGLSYTGSLGVLVSPDCSSACEEVAYVLGLLPQTRVIGYYPTNGMFGEVGRGQFTLPGGIQGQYPTGYSTDMDGNILIEQTGVVPDLFVPRTLDTMRREWVDGEDVVLTFAQDTLDKPLGAGIVPSGPPTVTTDFDLIAAAQSGTPFLLDSAKESYTGAEMAVPGTFTYTIDLGTSSDQLWYTGWCTQTPEQLADNWPKITLSVNLDGQDIPLSQLGELVDDTGATIGQPCHLYYAKFSDWPIGEHVLTSTMQVSAPMNDGSFDYTAGDYVSEYHIYVNH